MCAARTISMFAWRARGEKRQGQERQSRPGAALKATAESDYLRAFLRASSKPLRPRPSSASDAGSGTSVLAMVMLFRRGQ